MGIWQIFICQPELIRLSPIYCKDDDSILSHPSHLSKAPLLILPVPMASDTHYHIKTTIVKRQRFRDPATHFAAS